MGVAECLLRNDLVLPSASVSRNPDVDKYPPLTGVSGGGLVAAAIAAGVAPTDGMEALLQVSRKTNEQAFNSLHPG